MIRMVVSAALLVACGVGMAGCATTTSSASTDELAIAPAAKADPDARARVGGFLAQDEQTYAAWQQARKTCMSARGFSYTVRGPANYDIVKDGGFMPRLTQDDAQTSGYASTQRALSTNDAGAPATDDSQKGYDVALFGSDDDEVAVKFAGKSVSESAGGCTGAADKTIYGSARNQILLTDVAPNLIFDVMSTIRHEPKYTDKIVSDWASCMKAANYPQYRGPYEAYAKTKSNAELANRVAIADAKCRATTRYQQRMDDVIDRYFTGFLDKYDTQIASLTKIREQAAARARAYLAK
jgi:hypothetical protein